MYNIHICGTLALRLVMYLNYMYHNLSRENILHVFTEGKVC